MGFLIVSEAIQGLQDQIDSLRQLVGIAPSVNSVNFPFLIITDLYTTDNSPSAGNIAWTACTIYYQGQVYGISAGNTTGGAQQVWWVVGAPSFSSGNQFTPSPTTFAILANDLGTTDVLWNKLGTAAVQAANTNFQPDLYNGPNGAMFTDVVFTSHPGTNVTWTSGNVYYKGHTYPISSGSCDNSHFWIYWKFSSPSTFQVSATYPAMAADDFLIGINGSSGNPSQLGNFERTFELRQANGQTVYLSAGGSIFGFNSQGGQMYSLGRSGLDGVGSPGRGSINLMDGNIPGTAFFTVDGSNGQIQTKRSISPAAGASAGYIDLIVQGGVTYKIQLWS